MNFGIDFTTMRSMFFDRNAVSNHIDATTKKVFTKFGAYVRRRARRSIRKRKGSSAPGKPPSSHTGVLRRFIFFGFDSARRSVVIGPVLAPSKSGKAPAVLEHGGTVTLPSGERTDVAPRPYMGPAFEHEHSNLDSIWRDAVQ